MSLLDALFLDPHRDRRDVWIAARTDGIAGSGTLRDPYNGSTPARFDAIMRSLPANTRVALGSGTFLTRGYSDGAPAGYGWQPKAGQRILGSGIDVTTLKLVDAGQAGARYVAIGHSLATQGDPGVQVDFFEVSDLTIDCNLTSQPAEVSCGAVRIKGHHSRIRRVKAIQWGSHTLPQGCNVLSVVTADSYGVEPAIHDTGIEDCIVVDPAPDIFQETVLLEAGGWAEGMYGEVPFIRHCFVDGGSGHLDRSIRALSMSGCRGGIIEGNQVYNVRIGAGPIPNYSAASIVVRHNSLKHVLWGFSWDTGSLGQILLERNVIELATPTGPSAPPAGVQFSEPGSLPPEDFAFGNIIIRSNRIRCLPDSLWPGSAGRVSGAASLLVRDNLVADGPAQPFEHTHCDHVRYSNNRTPDGALIQGQDSGTGKKYDELETDAEDAFVLTVLKR
jgi:hypothetical protein